MNESEFNQRVDDILLAIEDPWLSTQDAESLARHLQVRNQSRFVHGFLSLDERKLNTFAAAVAPRFRRFCELAEFDPAQIAARHRHLRMSPGVAGQGDQGTFYERHDHERRARQAG